MHKMSELVCVKFALDQFAHFVHPTKTGLGLNFDQGVHRCEKMSSFRKLRWDFGVQSLPPVTAVVSVRTGITVSVAVVSIRMTVVSITMTVVSVPSISGGISFGFGISLGFPLPVSAVTAVVSQTVSVVSTVVSIRTAVSVVSVVGIGSRVGLSGGSGFGLSLGFPLPVSAVVSAVSQTVVSTIVSVTAVSVIAGMSIISIPGISGSIGLRLSHNNGGESESYEQQRFHDWF